MSTPFVSSRSVSSSSVSRRTVKKPGHPEHGGGVIAAPFVAPDDDHKITKPSSPKQTISYGTYGDGRTVKKLRLSKAFTVPEDTMLSDACRRMVHKRADAVLLTDADGLLTGIVTDKDITVRVIAERLKPENTTVSKIMTKNPVFVTMDTPAIEALQEMVKGKFRHLPVVEKGKVIALLDITKCMYDAIRKMEKAAEQGSAIKAAVEGVERQWGSDLCAAHYAFVGTLQERMFKPSLSTIIADSSKVEVVSPSDSVLDAAKKMRDSHASSVVIMIGDKPQGILTSKDVLMRVVARSLSPEHTPVEKVMTENPECATVDTTILEALHIMHEGKFLHLPVVDHDGQIVACVDVLQVTHAAISMVDECSGDANDMATTMIQKFWDSTLAQEPSDEKNETNSECSPSVTSDGVLETLKHVHPSLGSGNQFAFKFEDQEGNMHRFNCGTESINEFRAAVMENLAAAGHYQYNTRILYTDDEGDKVLLETDNDLSVAVTLAKSAGWKALRLHIENTDKKKEEISITDGSRTSLQAGILTSACLVAGISVMAYLRRSDL